MQRRSFWILLTTAALAAVIVAIGVPEKQQRGSDQASAFLFENLSDRINEVDRLSVRGAGNSQLVSLVRGAQSWTITELSSYPADWTRVREVLTGVAWASVSELKTSNPEYFSRLGVEEITDEDARGIMLEIGVGKDHYELILGHEAESRGGQYVRIAGADQSYLISETIDVPSTPIAWADDIIVDIGSGLVAEVNIAHADGELVTVSRISADDGDFSLHDVPKGRETQAAWVINRLAGAFTQLRMENVMPESLFSGTPGAAVRVLLFSGLELAAEVFEANGSTWIRIQAKRHESAIPAEGADPQEGQAQDQIEDVLSGEIAEINQRTSSWVYQISETKHAELIKRKNDLLKELESAPGP